MTQLEDQLRKAFRAKASDITPPPPPLELQPRPGLDPAARRGSGGFGTPLHRRLVPLAAAAAVLAVVAGVLAVGSLRPAHQKPPLVPPTAPIQSSVPPYYVTLTSVRPMPLHEPQAWPVRTTATVRATSTGAVIASVVPTRPYTEFVNVSAAADDRYFLLVAQYGKVFGGIYHDAFFMLRIDPTAADPAARTSLTRLPAVALPGDDQLLSMALSPDGRRLAVVAMHFGKKKVGHKTEGTATTYLRVYNLVTGRSRTWGGVIPGAGGPGPWTGGLSWRQDSRFLAVVVGEQPLQLRLLNVTAPGQAFAQDSKPLAAPRGPCWSFCSADITPDGDMIYVAYSGDGGLKAHGLPAWTKLVRFNVKSGTLTTVNKLIGVDASGHYTGYASGMQDDVLWTSYNGSEAIVAGVQPGAPNAGIYSGSHYTPIPWPANIEYAAW
jgi:hypothetical protein